MQSLSFASLTTCPEPETVPEGTPLLDGPGSVTLDDLREHLERALNQQPHGEQPHNEQSLGPTATDTRRRAALVVGTSGSTGRPKRTVLSASALTASGRATEQATGTREGAHWLLALPVHYVAGAQVVARSVLAGTSPAVTASLTPGQRFTARDFLRTAERMPAVSSGARMTSLVPTQVHTLLEEAARGQVAQDELLDALRSFTAILLGGAPASAALLERCREWEIPVVLTYGSAETSGVCVYGGSPLPGTRVALDGERILLGGPTLAEGYLHDAARTAASFGVDEHGTRWYRTDDLGEVRPDGTLEVLGRADDVIISGGLKISPWAVAQALEAEAGVREAIVLGVPDARWGQAVGAVVSRAPGHAPTSEELTASVARALGSAAAPKRVIVRDALPMTSTGKPDRAEALRWLTSHPAREANPEAG